MVDEIHLQPHMDYKGGNVVGASANDFSLASTAYVFMIQTFVTEKISCTYFTCKKMTPDGLYNVIRSIIVGLESMGLTVIAVVTDNNAVNRQCLNLQLHQN
jgi:hypothetical protein